MHDSPSAIVRRSRSSAATCSSIVEPSWLKMNRSWRATKPSTSASRFGLRPGPVANLDLELAAAQAGGDLERARGRRPRSISRSDLRDLGLGDPEQPQRLADVRLGALEHRARRRRSRARRGHICVQLARRPGQDDHRRAAVDADHQARRGAGRVDRLAPSGIIACLRFAASSASGSKRMPPREAGDDPRRSSASIPSSSTMLDPGEPRDDLGRQVVGGRARGRRW